MDGWNWWRRERKKKWKRSAGRFKIRKSGDSYETKRPPGTRRGGNFAVLKLSADAEYNEIRDYCRHSRQSGGLAGGFARRQNPEVHPLRLPRRRRRLQRQSQGMPGRGSGYG